MFLGEAWPGYALIVGRVVSETTMKDADHTVGDCPNCLVVGAAARFEFLIVEPCTRGTP